MARRMRASAALVGLVAALLVLVPLASPSAAATTTVHGKVTAVIFGNPVSGAGVFVLSPTTGRVIASDISDASGDYSVLVPSGSGLILVADPANNHVSHLVSSTPTAFPDGGDVTVNAQLVRALGGIEGRLTDSSSGNGIATGIALAVDAATGHVRGGAVTDSFGFYVIRNLRSVGYRMVFLDASGDHAAGSFPSVVNVVGGALQVIGTSPLTAQTAPTGSTVQGTVTASGGGALAGMVAVVYDATTLAFEGAAVTDGSGSYSVTVDAGQHVVQVVDLAGTYRSEVHDNHADGEPADGTPVTAPATVDVALGLARGTIAGTVTDDVTTAPLAGIWVLASDDSGVLGVTRTGAGGDYTLTNIPAGETEIWFVEDSGLSYLPEYFDDQVGRGFGYDGSASTVTVTGGATATVDAGLTAFESVAPTVALTAPADGASIDRGSVVAADYSCADTGGSGVASCVGDVVDGQPIDTSTLGPHTFSVTATDVVGNTTTVTHDYTVVDGTDPTVSVTSPTDGATFDRGQVVNAAFSCADEVGGSGIATCVGDVADGQPIDTSTLGPQDFSVTATDVVGNTTTVTNDYTVVDGTDPTVSITTPTDGATFDRGQVVKADFSCADEVGGSGIATCVGDVATGSSISTSTVGPHTFSVTATDVAGNTTTVTNHYTVVDGTDPTVTITTPAFDASYTRGELVISDFTCSDDPGGSGIASCLGGLADGGPIDTSSLGPHELSVTATDSAGNASTVRRRYLVLPATCFGDDVTVDLRYDEHPTSGRDVILGTPGDDVVRGRGGDDVMCGQAGQDDLRGGAGQDRVRGGPGDDRLSAGPGGGLLAGIAGDDTLVGGTGPDTLRGGPGADDLRGGPGNDLGDGGPGRDACVLAPGADRQVRCEPVAVVRPHRGVTDAVDFPLRGARRGLTAIVAACVFLPAAW